MDIVATLLCILVTTSILGFEFSRRMFDQAIHRLVAVEVARHIDELYFVTYGDISKWYKDITNTVFGFEDLSLELWEARKVLLIVEKNPDLGNKGGIVKKQVILENARASFPTTFDCYRFYGSGRALIAAIAVFTLASEGTSGNTATAVVIVLAIILLSILPAVSMSLSGLARVVTRRKSQFR